MKEKYWFAGARYNQILFAIEREKYWFMRAVFNFFWFNKSITLGKIE